MVFRKKCTKNLYCQVAAQTVGLAEKSRIPTQLSQAALPILMIVGKKSKKHLDFWVVMKIVVVVEECYKQQSHPAPSAPIVKVVEEGKRILRSVVLGLPVEAVEKKST